MHWLQSLDVGVFRFINTTLANPLFDRIMPWLGGNALFFPALVLLGIALVWKGGIRGLVCVSVLLVILPMGDQWVCRSIKRGVERPRPFAVLADVHLPAAKDAGTGKPPPTLQNKDKPVSTGSMPSSHAANWFAATMVAFIYYRRSLCVMLPAALVVSFSRVYNGVHYPSDVMAGAILGAGYAAAAIWFFETLWQSWGRKWFPLWWTRFPSLVGRRVSETERQEMNQPAQAAPRIPSPIESHWLRLGYIVIGVLLVARLVYIAGDTIQLTGDEAYQWLWSKHLALSYYSKPPLIAYAQFLGTTLFGDTAFGVRFFSPVSAAILSFLVLRFVAREFNARAGFFLLLILTATPLVSAGAVLMTVDVFSVLFWMAVMVAGWRAIQPNAPTSSWLWVGLWMGLGFLSKYTELFQWVSWALVFALWPPARRHLRRPGPYLALLVNVIAAVPVLIWNYQHDWITISHVAGNAKAGEPWSPAILDFLGSEAALLNPVFLIGMIWAAIVFWRRSRHDLRLLYCFSMGAPLFMIYMLYSFHSRVLPNWIAPSVLPLFCLMVGYWDQRWQIAKRPLKAALILGLVVGLPVVIIAHDTYVVGKLTGRLLPVNQDPLHRARGWKDIARLTAGLKHQLMGEGKPVFIIAGHYRLAGELSFYWPESRRADISGIYCRTTSVPVDQFYFWPSYSMRKGENAVFLQELSRDNPTPRKAPAQLYTQFDSVSDLGIHEVLDRGRVLWRLQFFACRGLN